MATVLPDKLLRLMSAEDRKALGKAGVTTAEALERANIKSERDLQTQLIEFLRLRGVEDVLCPRMDKKSTINAGWPDLTFVIHAERVLPCNPKRRVYVVTAPTPCAWEVKLPGRKPTPEQAATHDRLRKAGWQVAVITSVQDAQQELARLGA